MSKKEKIGPSELVNTFSPHGIIEEIKYNFVFSYPVKDFFRVRETFSDTVALFEGKVQGYKKCGTPYHDINHTCDVLLAFSRILDGYNIKNKPIPVNKAVAGLIAALLHDTGFIQKSGAVEISNASYILEHEKRSIDYALAYLSAKGYDEDFIRSVSCFIDITDLNVSMEKIKFADDFDRLVAAMLGSADLIGQMAARTYLERLLFLYREFLEAGIGGYKSEYDLLKKTVKFYDSIVVPRLEKDFENVKKYTAVHFKKRYDIAKDHYAASISSQLNYLKKVVEPPPDSYRKKLRRSEKNS